MASLPAAQHLLFVRNPLQIIRVPPIVPTLEYLTILLEDCLAGANASIEQVYSQQTA